MAPKRAMRAAPKAKAKGKAKARPKRLARPAAAPGRVAPRIRRPARRAADGGEDAWDQGQIMPLCRVSLDQLRPGTSLVCEEAEFFGAKTKIAGEVIASQWEGDERYLQMKPTGTNSEGVLRSYTQDATMPFRLHLCKAQCDKAESGDRMIHAIRGRKRKDADEEMWVTSLEGVGPV